MMTALKRKDLYLLAFLFLVVLLIFYPVFYSEYIYTDEINELWLYRPGSDVQLIAPGGRWITELLVSKSFAAVDTIHGVTYIRIFSLFIWLAFLPVWYVIIKRLAANTPGYEYLPFFTCLYLVTSLPFSVSVQWAACIMVPIANTAGLLSGAIWYLHIRDIKKWEIPIWPALGAIAAGLFSLSTYQSGFGCFLIPFLFHYINTSTNRKDLVLIKGLAFYFLVYAIYFVIFKIYVSTNQVGSDSRAGLSTDPIGKLLFFFSQPLKRSFWLNLIVDGDNKLARAIYKVLMVGWIVLAFVRFGIKQWLNALKYIGAVLLVFIISYLPSLIVKENFASNRTMIAINLLVWLVCADMVVYFVKKAAIRKVIVIGVSVVILGASWYNFNKVFLQPVQDEYIAIRNYVQQNYNRNITTIYLIKPAGDAFEKKYHIQSSMDEFGVPSTFPEWVPINLMQQMVFEITRDRKTAEQLKVKYWPDIESFTGSGETATNNALLVNVPALIDAEQAKH
jgi:hypothetical protein